MEENDDLLETSSAVYHKHVAMLQMKLQEIKEQMIEDNRVALEKYLTDNPDEDCGETSLQYAALLDHNIGAYRLQTYQCIEQERIRMGERNFAILMRRLPPT